MIDRMIEQQNIDLNKESRCSLSYWQDLTRHFATHLPLISKNDTAEVCFYPLETIVLRQSYSNKEGGGTLVQKILFDSVSY